ncbi:unnamed protein product, partial [marine sediment metagenome]
LIFAGAPDWLSKTATEYLMVTSGFDYWSATEDDHRQVCPTSGKIKNLYVKLLWGDPGNDPDAYRFTLRVNGASPANGLVVTIVANDTTGDDTAHEVTVAAGDVLTLMCEPLESPGSTVWAFMGMTFVADTDGESLILAGTTNDLHNTDTEYNLLSTFWISSWQADESLVYQMGQECTLKKLYVLLSAAPGDGKSYTFTLRKGDGLGDGNLAVTITGAATTTGNDLV